MSLRRVIGHFRRLEWTAIGIDFVIVVVGVFIGIQVSNWNSARLDRTREDLYFEGISAETLRPFGLDAMQRGIELGLAGFAPNDSRKVIQLARDDERFTALLKTERAYTTFYVAIIVGLNKRAEALVADIDAGEKGEK